MSEPMTLKPCPFCGGEASHEIWGDVGYHSIGCKECDITFDYCENSNDALAAWNRRANLAQPAQAVDVGAIREVIAELTKDGVLHHPFEKRCADKLTRAITGESGRNYWLGDFVPMECPSQPCISGDDGKSAIKPTYYVHHPDGSYSVAEPQP